MSSFVKQGTDGMSIKEMRAVVKRAGLSSADCISKADLRARCEQAQARLAEAAELKEKQSASNTGALAALLGDTLLYKNGGKEMPTVDALGGSSEGKCIALPVEVPRNT